MFAILPTQMLNNFYALVRVEYSSFDSQLLHEIRSIDARATAKGMLNSGGTIRLVCEAGGHSLSVRCRMAWALLFKAMNAYGLAVDKETISLFLSELGAQATNADMTVRSIVNGSAVFRGSLPDSAKKAGMAIIDKKHEHEIAKMKADADLLAAASQNLKPAIPQPGIIISGDGNVIISGDSNQVNVSTQIDREAVTALASGMQLMLGQLHLIPPTANIDVREVNQLVEETLAELKATQPNGLKIKGSVKTIAETIKFIPALKAAYDTIKSAAAMANIYLP